MSPKHIRISDFDYPLPEERIAKFPLPQRDHSKLLIYDHGRVGEDIFSNLPQHLPEGALMVFNNTRVIQARLHFRKRSREEKGVKIDGALIEIFLLEPASPNDYELMFQTRGRCSWLCIVGNLKKWKEGTLTRVFSVGDSLYVLKATRGALHGTSHWIDFEWEPAESSSTVETLSFAEILDALGELPIPPYLNRATEESDKTTYQTVYSKIKGSVAAPTAGLHFTPEVLQAIDYRGIDREELTLHVGAGTFKPVKSELIEGHDMHTEYISVRRQTVEKLLAHDCQAIAVGTTSVRTLESLYWMGLKLLRDPSLSESQLHVSQWEPYDDDTASSAPCSSAASVVSSSATPVVSSSATPVVSPVCCDSVATTSAPCSPREALQALLAWMDRHHLDVLHSSTQIIIAPGYQYRIVNRLITNFHQPRSTLLLLVSAFVRGDWRRIYDYALAHDFRFLSYGDSSLLIP